MTGAVFACNLYAIVLFGSRTQAAIDHRVEVKVLRSEDGPGRAGADASIWLRGSDGIEVAGADRNAWDAAVASFNKVLRSRAGPMHPASTGDVDGTSAPPAGSMIDVLGLAELRRRTR
jgi:hypothetical protein